MTGLEKEHLYRDAKFTNSGISMQCFPESINSMFKLRYDRIFSCNKFEDARKELESVSKWLSEISHTPGELMKSFNTTNLIESAFSVPKSSLRRVKKWNLHSDMLDRWISISLLYQEKSFRKVKGVKSLNLFISKFSKFNIDKT